MKGQKGNLEVIKEWKDSIIHPEVVVYRLEVFWSMMFKKETRKEKCMKD